MSPGPGARKASGGAGGLGAGGGLPATPPAGLPSKGFSRPSGPYTPVPRGLTSQLELKLAWQYPMLVDKAREDARTSALPARHALSAAEAFATLAGDDRRPLLVLRECATCNGTDDALLNRQEDNERTLVMSRWFHCLKLPPDVLTEDHPFHALFADDAPGHLFFAHFDGSGRKDLRGQESRAELWKLMESFLDSEYVGGCDASLGALLELLDRFDRLDEDLGAVQDRIDALTEEGRADSAKMRRLRVELAALEDGKAQTRAEATRLSERKLEPEPPAPPGENKPAGTRG